ncbi:MAG: hypothetical protein K1X51_18225 [Rhodospirillaceae bacterium]|nr:hypothetical protein [Rhodospirillaceae bacterium]
MNPFALFASRTATLGSPLSPQACAERIAAITDGPLVLLGTRPLIGSATANGVRVRRRINYRNSFQTALSATFETQGAGTIIRCRFGMMPLVIVFLAVWMGLALLAGAGLAVSQMTGSPGSETSPFIVLFPLGFLAFGFVMASVGRSLGRKDEAYILETVRAATEATVVEREPGYETLTAEEMEDMTRRGPTSRLMLAVVMAVLLLLGLAGWIFSRIGPVS